MVTNYSFFKEFFGILENGHFKNVQNQLSQNTFPENSCFFLFYIIYLNYLKKL